MLVEYTFTFSIWKDLLSWATMFRVRVAMFELSFNFRWQCSSAFFNYFGMIQQNFNYLQLKWVNFQFWDFGMANNFASPLRPCYFDEQNERLFFTLWKWNCFFYQHGLFFPYEWTVLNSVQAWSGLSFTLEWMLTLWSWIELHGGGAPWQWLARPDGGGWCGTSSWSWSRCLVIRCGCN